MAKSSAQIKCESLWYEAVRLKEPYCRACGKPYPEIHHVILKSQLDWQVQFDVDFGIGLCPEHHRGDERAPHVDARRFRTELLPRVLNSMDPPRAAKIQAYMTSPRRPQREKPDFKEIRAELKALLKKLDPYISEADIPQNRRR